MQEAVPRAANTADNTLIMVWITNRAIFLFVILTLFLVH